MPRTSASSRTRFGAVVTRPAWPIVHMRSLWTCTGGASRSIGLGARAYFCRSRPAESCLSKYGVVAQKNAVPTPRRMSTQATSIRIQSGVTARDGELCILDLQTLFSAVRDVWIRAQAIGADAAAIDAVKSMRS